jgi:hypothetical protein
VKIQWFNGALLLYSAVLCCKKAGLGSVVHYQVEFG